MMASTSANTMTIIEIDAASVQEVINPANKGGKTIVFKYNDNKILLNLFLIL